MRRRATGPVLTTKNGAAENMKARCVAVCSSVLQWVAVCCSVKISEVRRNESLLRITFKFVGKLLAGPLYLTSHSHGRNAKTSAHTLLSDKRMSRFLCWLSVDRCDVCFNYVCFLFFFFHRFYQIIGNSMALSFKGSESRWFASFLWLKLKSSRSISGTPQRAD